MIPSPARGEGIQCFPIMGKMNYATMPSGEGIIEFLINEANYLTQLLAGEGLQY